MVPRAVTAPAENGRAYHRERRSGPGYQLTIRRETSRERPHRTTIRSLWSRAAFMAVSILPAEAQDVLGETGIKGAGSSFVYPVLSRWSREYRSWLSRGGDFPVANAGLEDPPASSALQYEPVGSLAGTLRVNGGAVDFGASDMPMRSEELARLGLGQFPIVIGAVVVAVNVDGVGPGAIGFTGPLLADVFLGKITRWSDPAIKALNPALKLPDAAIGTVHRSDGSGTTFNFTDFLSKVSPEWKVKVGAGLLVPWPSGSGANGNEGVAQAVSRVRNSIGYVEYAQAMQLKLSYALVQNRAGQFVKPDSGGRAGGGGNSRLGKDERLLSSPDRWPRRGRLPHHRDGLRARAEGGVAQQDRGGARFPSLVARERLQDRGRSGYVPLPAPLVQQVLGYWSRTFGNGA